MLEGGGCERLFVCRAIRYPTNEVSDPCTYIAFRRIGGSRAVKLQHLLLSCNSRHSKCYNGNRELHGGYSATILLSTETRRYLPLRTSLNEPVGRSGDGEERVKKENRSPQIFLERLSDVTRLISRIDSIIFWHHGLPFPRQRPPSSSSSSAATSRPSAARDLLCIWSSLHDFDFLTFSHMWHSAHALTACWQRMWCVVVNFCFQAEGRIRAQVSEEVDISGCAYPR